ncbi:MAG: CHAT domain-containing protein [Desulfobacteraceae bacterium]|nr:MAG: CHAT domain-containing protein [Desulfobacteraceae bacterium]
MAPLVRIETEIRAERFGTLSLEDKHNSEGVSKMGENQVYLERPFLKISPKVFRFASATFIMILALFPSCAEKRMSVKEAKEVTVSMNGESFVPPPRHIEDIINLLDEQKQVDTEVVERLKARADALPPENASIGYLARFYGRRAFAAWELGRDKQALEDYRVALQYVEKSSLNGRKILLRLAKSEKKFGNFRRALDVLERMREDSKNTGMFNNLVSVYAKIGDIENAKKAKTEGLIECKKPRKRSKPSTIQHASDMEATVLELDGRWKDAEPYVRKSIDTFSSRRKYRPTEVIGHRVWLVNNLVSQGRLLEAELEARQTLKEAVQYGGIGSNMTLKALDALGKVVLAQGRLEDAEKLIRTEIRLLEDSGFSDDSHFMDRARMSLGHILATEGEFGQAMEQYDIVWEKMRENQHIYDRWFGKKQNMMLSLIMMGRAKEALPWLSKALKKYEKQLGVEHYRTSETLALKGLAYTRMGNQKKGLQYFSKAIPLLLETDVDEGSAYPKTYPRMKRLKIILEEYMLLLSKIRGTEMERALGIDAVAETFRLADVCRSRSVQRALEASAARASALDPDLADLVRKEQDAEKQIDVLQQLLLNLVIASPEQQLPQVIKDLHARLETLAEARMALTAEIQRRFPKYSDFVNPKPGTVSIVQSHLRPRESLISIYTAKDHTYVWVIPQMGKIQLFVSELAGERLDQIVTHLREALDPNPQTFGDIPDFDLVQAYELYEKLLKPVEKGWYEADDLVVVAHEVLGQLPLGVLPTVPYRLDEKEDELFSDYRKVPWLIRKASITRLPSVSSFATLRALHEADPKRKPFVGFGDPLFNRSQLAQAEREKSGGTVELARRSGNLHIRGVRVTGKGNLDSKKIVSSQLGHLNRLPDTAEEIKSIGRTLGADPVRDVFLGKRACESQVKTMDLSNRRVIGFATHALVPGDLDGLHQPALALSSPTVTGDKDDGLLTMGEVLKLRLNADWVVLSACNTGAADGAGAEAVSGLGRAFFYAGTRAILVSMWPVETTSARKLTTGVFRYQKKDGSVSRARALQKSMLALINGPGLKDKVTDKIVASYAHPIFWAPFILVGDGQ